MSSGVFLFYDNTRSRLAQISQNLLNSFGWEFINHPPITQSGTLGLLSFHQIERIFGWETSFKRQRGQADGGKVAEGVGKTGLQNGYAKTGSPTTK